METAKKQKQFSLSPCLSIMSPIRSLFTVLFIAAVLVCCSCMAVAQHPDLITSLPGAPQVNFNQYSGHLVVNGTTQKNLFYWFVESQSNPAKDPLIVRCVYVYLMFLALTRLTFCRDTALMHIIRIAVIF
jgi:Serine carboxypeptidase